MLYILPKLCNSVFGKFTIAAQPFHFSMSFAVSPVFLQLRKGERQSGYSTAGEHNVLPFPDIFAVLTYPAATHTV